MEYFYVCWITLLYLATGIQSQQSRVELQDGINKFDKNGTKFQKLLLDSSTGTLYVGAQNALFRFSGANLSLLQNITTGPVLDSPKCDPKDVADCDTTKMTNIDVKILLNDPKFKKILMCGSTSQGQCSFYNEANLNVSTVINGKSEGSVVPYVAGTKSVVARYGDIPSSNMKGLYVAQEYDHRPLTLAPHAISTRLIQKNGSKAYTVKNFYENKEHGIGTFKDIYPDYKSDYVIKYIHTFEYGGFSFYLTVQKQYLHKSNYSTRLVRICNEDPGYYSYSEVELACRKKNGVTSFFNVAVDAHLGEIGQEFAEHFRITEDEKVLYIIFGKSHPYSVDINEDAGSGKAQHSDFVEFENHLFYLM